MEIADTNLQQLLEGKVQDNEYFDEETLEYIVENVIDGLQELHDNCIIHTRIRPSNILVFRNVDDTYTYKIQLPMGNKINIAINPPEYLNAMEGDRFLDSFSDIW